MPSNTVVYREAAAVLDQLEKKQGSLKSLVFDKRTHSAKSKVYAIACETLKHKSVIAEVIEDCKLLEKEPKLSLHLGMVLVYDLLFGKGIQCGGHPKQAILRHQKELHTAFHNVKEILDLSQSTLPLAKLPRYGRVNLLKTTVNDVISRLCKEGYVVVEQVANCRKCQRSPEIQENPNSQYGDVSVLCSCAKTFSRDSNLREVLIFPPSAPLMEHPLYDSMEIILQDKASCLPAPLLCPLPGSHVIDTCAAPGNKTTHLAALMENKGCIYAFDKHPQRFQTLQRMVTNAGASIVKPSQKDFLTTDPADYPTVQYILVDPSCSGSGMIGRMDYDREASADSHRLTALAEFQKRILRHALSFPSVERVVYSTCSIHRQENEDVVFAGLNGCSSCFELAHIMPEWETRGLPVFDGAEHCIRASPEEHKTNGFFVALFQRVQRISTSAEDHLTPSVRCINNSSDMKKATHCARKEKPPCVSVYSFNRKKKRKRKKHVPVNA